MQIANDAPASFRASAVRPGAFSLMSTAVREVISRQRLIRYLISADVKKKGANTVLGNVWWVLDPLLATLVYVIVMEFIFQRKIEHFPLYLLAAVIPFKWFTATVGDTVGSVVRAEKLIKQIQFPKIVLPLAATGSEVVSFGFGLGVLVAVEAIAYSRHLSLMLLWIPVIAAVQFVFSLGFALILSAVTVFYRDIGILVGHLMRLLFFLSPIMWSFDALGDRGGALEKSLGDVGFAILRLNPLAILIAQYRHVAYGVVVEKTTPEGTLTTFSAAVAPDLIALFWVLVTGVVLTTIGLWVFKRVEPAFAKVL
jgi:lipopolysaccharide transport system permease protein